MLLLFRSGTVGSLGSPVEPAPVQLRPRILHYWKRVYRRL